jgi:hypothetical protein
MKFAIILGLVGLSYARVLQVRIIPNTIFPILHIGICKIF